MTLLLLLGLLLGGRPDPITPTSKPRREFNYQTAVGKAIYSYDGRLVLVAANRQRIGVFHGRTSLLFGELRGHKQAVSALASWPDRDTVVSGGVGGELLFWRSKTGKLIGRFQLPGRIQGIEPQPGTTTVAVLANGVAYLFDYGTGKRMPLVSWSPGRTPTAMAFNHTGTQLAIGYADGSVLIRNFLTRQSAAASPFSTPVRAIAFRRDSLIAVAGTPVLFVSRTSSPGSGKTLPVSKAVGSVVQTDKTGLLLGTLTGDVLRFDLATQQEALVGTSKSTIRNLVANPRERLVLVSYAQESPKSWLLKAATDMP